MLLYEDNKGKKYVCLPEFADLGFDSTRAYELIDKKIGLVSKNTKALTLLKEVTIDELYAMINN